MSAPRITPRHAAGALWLFALAMAGVAVLSRGCELVVAAWDLGPTVQVHPAIRAWDAGARE